MSLLLQALQKAAKNRESGGPEQEPERDALPYEREPHEAGPYEPGPYDPGSHEPGAPESGLHEPGPREPELGELPADPDALSLTDDDDELFDPEPEPEDEPALTTAPEPTIAPARPPERPVLRPATAAGGSGHAATILRANEARSTGALDWVRDRPVHAFAIAAAIFGVFYGAYVYLQIFHPAVLRGDFLTSFLQSKPPSAAKRRTPPPHAGRIEQAQPAQPPAAAGAVASSASAAPSTPAGTLSTPAGTLSTPPGTLSTPARAAAVPPAEAGAGEAAERPFTGMPQAKASRRTAERPVASAAREKPPPRRATVEVEAAATLDDSVAVRAPPASATPPSVPLMQAWEALNQGRFEEARALYQEVLRIEPHNVDALLGLAAIDTRAGNGEEAALHYARALELEPRNSTAQAGLISLLGQADPLLSETRLKQLIARGPTGFLYFALGNLYARQGRWPLAQPAYFQAYQLQPDNPDYAYNLAVGLEHLGQAKIALNYYRRALELSSLRGHASFEQARVQERVGQLSARVGSE
jgi:tetratricopeptide (TPR) repeat protein